MLDRNERLRTFRANPGGFFLGVGGFFGAEQQGESGVESNALAGELGGRVAKSIAANGTQAVRQDMAQIAPGELHAGEGFAASGITVAAIFPGEGDREIGDCTDPFGELAFHPLCGIQRPALRARAVIAGMEGKVSFPTFFAGLDMPAHKHGATMGECPDGATPRPIQHGVFPQEVGQEAAQRRDHRSRSRNGRTIAEVRR